MGSMEHPVFSLSTKPDHRVRKYEHNGNTVEILPGAHGLATIHDKDVLLYLASQIMNDINDKREAAKRTGAKNIEAPPQTVRFTAYDMLFLTNRATSKLGYKRLEAALDRLSGTRIKTNIRTGGKVITKNFGIIEWFDIIREDRENPNSRMVGVEVKLSDWFYNALLGQEVLTISENYFRLRKPIERRMYELCRKHCGHQNKWEIGLKLLRKKAGSGSSIKEFRRIVNKIVVFDHMPDYLLSFDEYDRDKLVVRPRKPKVEVIEHKAIHLPTEAYELAEKILRNTNLCKYAVEAEWLDYWEATGKPAFEYGPDRAYIGFCKMKAKRAAA